jgi:hypothetical protein
VGPITEYFVLAKFADGSSATYPPGSFEDGRRDGDTITIVHAK